jgi:hypothetical protein
VTFPAPPSGLRGQLVEHVPCQTVSFDLGSTPPAVQYRLFGSLFGPAVANANTGPIIFGVCWQVTEPNCTLVGYSQWCCNSGQDTTALNFATWHLTALVTGTLLAGATITGGPLTQGAWNDTFLPAPVPLSAGSTYVTQMGIVDGFPVTAGYWGSGGVAYRGMQSGPLEAFSDQGASNAAPFSQNQNNFAAGTNDPTAGIGPNGNSGFNEWLDVIVSTG